jgi:hypothetical protein
MFALGRLWAPTARRILAIGENDFATQSAISGYAAHSNRRSISGVTGRMEGLAQQSRGTKLGCSFSE